MTYYIYILTSPSGKKYVGQTSNINKRFIHYEKCLCCGQTKLFSALVKYGFENFNKEILVFENISKREISEKEIEFVKNNDSFLNGYNCSIGGEYPHQKYYTEEERKEAVRRQTRERSRIYRKLYPERYYNYNKKYNNRPGIKEKKKEYEDKRRIKRNLQRNQHRKENLEMFRLKEKEN